MASKDVTLTELGAMLTHVVNHMAVKEDVADIRATMATKNDLAHILSELKALRDDLDALREQVENITGYRKEIDHALDRIAAIERHLGVDRKTAA
jgi:uncharacterized membrane protein